MGGIGCNFGLIVSKTFIYLANGPKTGKFEYDSYKTYGFYGISNTIFDGSTYFNSIVIKTGTCAVYKQRMHGFENGVDRMQDNHTTFA